MIDFGRVILMARNRLGISQRDLAKRMRMSYVHLCNLENGIALPSRKMVSRFTSEFGLDFYVLAWAASYPADGTPMSRAAKNMAGLLIKEFPRRETASCP